MRGPGWPPQSFLPKRAKNPSCQTNASSHGVVHAGNRSISYGDIGTGGGRRRPYTDEEVEKIPIKTRAERLFICKAWQALDVPSKVDGSGRYGSDAAVDGMIYARPKVP